MFFMSCDNWKQIFLIKVSLLWDFFKRSIVALKTSVFKEVLILRHLLNNSALQIPKFQNKAIVYYIYIL